jgi:TRAP-type C4-dicarboxylate transport system permease large subunit
VGARLFVGCAGGELRIEQALKMIGPFCLAIFVALMRVTYIPAISMFLSNLMN